MSILKQRFLLVSDMHYTTDKTYDQLKKLYPNCKASAAAGNAFGKTQREKIEKIYDDIIEENRRSKLDAVFILGHLSIDDEDYRKLPDNYCRKLKEDLMDRLPCHAYALPGNHDSYPNGIWKEVMGYDRKYSLEFEDAAFIMDDSYAEVPSDPQNPGSGAKFSPTDPLFLQACIKKHKGKRIFFCSHFIDTRTEDRNFSDACKEIIKSCDDLIFMFRGHTHVHSVEGFEFSGKEKPVIDIGGYGYNGQIVNGKYDFNVFDPAWAWGYQILEIYDDKVETYHVRTANDYTATNGNFHIKEAVIGKISRFVK